MRLLYVVLSLALEGISGGIPGVWGWARGRAQAVMADKLPHETHHEMAHTLMRTFYEALEPHFLTKGYMTKDDLDKAFTLMASFWPKVLPLFGATCKECSDARGDKVYVPDIRRKDFLTRLIFSYVLTNVPMRHDSATRVTFPQVLVRGIQKNVSSLFHEREYDELNRHAQSIFMQIGTDKDNEVWPLIQADDTLSIMADKILIRFLLRFKQFNHQRQVFTRNITLTLMESSYSFSDADFCLVFQGLFGRFEEMLRSDEGRLRIDLFFGEDSAEKLNKVFFQFSNFRQSVGYSQKSQPQKRAAVRA